MSSWIAKMRDLVDLGYTSVPGLPWVDNDANVFAHPSGVGIAHPSANLLHLCRNSLQDSAPLLNSGFLYAHGELSNLGLRQFGKLRPTVEGRIKDWVGRNSPN